MSNSSLQNDSDFLFQNYRWEAKLPIYDNELEEENNHSFHFFSPVESIRISFFRIYKEAKRHRAAIRFSLNGFSSHSEILLPTLHRNTFPGWTEILFNNKQHTFWDIAQNLTFMAPLIFLQDPTKFWRAATIKVRNHITLKTFHSTEEKFRNSNLDINILNAPLLFVYHICFWQYFHTNARLRNIWS